MHGLSEKELKVLKALLHASDTPQKTLALTLNITESDVSRIIKELKRRNIIKGFTVDIDYRELGYRDTGFFLFKVKDKRNSDIAADKIAKIREVVDVQEVYGQSWDIIVRIAAFDAQHLREVTKEISSMDEVDTTTDPFTIISAGSIKSTRGPDF